MRISTLVVEGPLAMAEARLRAAHRADSGLQILDVAHLAARLAGGFVRPASSDDVELAIKAALEADDYVELEAVRRLPGMVRAVAATLGKAWRSGVGLDDDAYGGPRVGDVASLQRRVRAALPPAALTPPDLVAAAMARMRFAPSLFGPIEFASGRGLDAVWRPLVEALASCVEVRWDGGGRASPASAREADVVVCSDHRSEVVDAMRWVRALLSSGAAAPGEVAIAAADPSAWDEHVLACVEETGLPVRFSHGVPALATADGQTCAALADVLSQGLSQGRVRRVLTRLRGGAAWPSGWPADPLRGVPRSAALTTLAHWSRALEAAATTREDGFDSRGLLPMLAVLAGGAASAVEVGPLLGDGARDLWNRALRRSPAEAVAFRLAELRTPDRGDAAANVSWGPASHLAAAPRRFVRLVGLSAGGWPRASASDPLLPEHLFGGRRIEAPSVTERDRADFDIVRRGASDAFVLSHAKRSAQGRVLAPSPLLPAAAPTRFVGRGAVPHACSEADRLLSRPGEAAVHPVVARAMACLRARRTAEVTDYDGRIRPDHPAILRAYAATQSATSLRLLLRDPQGFVWTHAMGWRSGVVAPIPIELDAAAFGELVHELLHLTVCGLEPEPGLAGAGMDERAAALEVARRRVFDDWPSRRETPPGALWRHSVDAAAGMALAALALDPPFQPGTRSWTELRFGQAEPSAAAATAPWDETAPVLVPGTTVRLRGSIDRLDLLASGDLVRLSDWKTGRASDAREVRLDGGRELQRVVYAIAAMSNLPAVRRAVSRLVHLAATPVRPSILGNVDDAIETLAGHLKAAEVLLRSGRCLPGVEEAAMSTNPLRLALPAMAEAYFDTKAAAFRRGFGRFARVWSET